MWDFASIVERSRKAAASVSQLEYALARNPNSRSLQISLAASKKFALRTNEELQNVALYNRVDLCNYRLIPSDAKGYKVASVSSSLMTYQGLFSQLYDARKSGPKINAVLGKEAELKSSLEVAYTYSGSLGILLFAYDERGLFDGDLDATIDDLYTAVESATSQNIRSIAQQFGGAVVKRLHDWSRANVDGGFSADMRWKRSDGRELAYVCDIRHLERIAELSTETSDEKINVGEHEGILVGADLNSRSFHFVVPNGLDLRGTFASEFPDYIELKLGSWYRAIVREKRTVFYATERQDVRRELVNLLPKFAKQAIDQSN